MKIGVLAVQGDFEAHRAMLDSLAVDSAEIRTVADLNGLDAVVLPGGESTTQLKFLQEEGLFHPL
ncbi:MAG TPA: pyridoxal 5'-phosphate synthase glutaminase subunit PdxT, partial [Candidatus Acidoferrales bacterium]|nr:pyridoxal 5'-phosphate synthase glutaminase subunit PdxT [Candidatus Acidoferrales bacterium]